MTGACWASTSPDALVELCIRPNGRGMVLRALVLW